MKDFFKGYGIFSSGIIHISAREAVELCKKGAVMIDVREEYMNRFKMFDVEELIFCPFGILDKSFNDLPKDKPLIFADAVGLKSKAAVEFVLNKGLKNIANLAGGIVEWERDGYPLVMDKSERLTGSCMCMLRKRDKK